MFLGNSLFLMLFNMFVDKIPAIGIKSASNLTSEAWLCLIFGETLELTEIYTIMKCVHTGLIDNLLQSQGWATDNLVDTMGASLGPY